MWSQIVTTGGNESLPEPVTKCAHNKKDPLNQTHNIGTQKYGRPGISEKVSVLKEHRAAKVRIPNHFYIVYPFHTERSLGKVII